MTSQYKGMRWLKCDLQVQTPEDSRHWQDQELKMLEPRRPIYNGQKVISKKSLEVSPSLL